MESVEQIWVDHHRALLSFIRYRLPDKNLADDVLQDVFIKVQTKLATLHKAERLQSWLFQITRHTLIDYYRKQRIRESLPTSLSVNEPDQSEECWHSWVDCVRPMINLLPKIYRDALILSDIEGKSLKVVATQLGLSLPAAKSRVQRGRAKLKQAYLDCCLIEFDRRGNPISCETRTDCHLQC
jgi:RNA polymerase sigma-70 factor, ECF subfamily